MRKDQGTEMSNTRVSLGTIWAKLTVGRLLWKEEGRAVVRAGVCAVLREPVTSGAFSFWLLVPESVSSSSGANPCPYSLSPQGLTLDDEAVAALPYL